MKCSIPSTIVIPFLALVTGCGGGAADEIAESIADQVVENLNVSTTNSDGETTQLPNDVDLTESSDVSEDTLDDEPVVIASGGPEPVTDSTSDSTPDTGNTEDTNTETAVDTSGSSDTETAGPSESTGTSESDSSESTETVASVSRVRVSWNIPSVRENGDALELSEIDGYRLRFTHVDTGDQYTYEVTDPTVDNVTFQLNVSYLNAAGTWQYQILAYDAEGVYGDYSEPQIVVMN